MSEGDGVRDNNDMSKTGKFARVDLEPRLDPERNKRKVTPKVDDENLPSATGIMRIFTPSEESTKADDEDKPAE